MTARLWDASTGKPLSTLRHQDQVWVVAFGPDGKTVASGSVDKTARLWDAVTGKTIGAALQHEGGLLAVAYSPDGTILLTGSTDGTARLWEASTGKPLGMPFFHRAGVVAVAFSPDGTKFFTGSVDDTGRLWTAPRSVDVRSDRLRLWAEVITGLEADEHGDTRVLDATQWQDRKDRLRKLGGTTYLGAALPVTWDDRDQRRKKKGS